MIDLKKSYTKELIVENFWIKLKLRKTLGTKFRFFPTKNQKHIFA